MSNLVRNIPLKGPAIGIFAALIAAAPIAPASAQGVPAGLLRLDSVHPTNGGERQLTAAEQSKLRTAYARASRKNPAQ
jgi:hypothetical protein